MKICLICSLLTPASGWILISPPRDVLEPRKRRRRRDETLTSVESLFFIIIIIVTSIVIVIVIAIVIVIVIVIVVIIIIMQEIIVEKYPRGYFPSEPDLWLLRHTDEPQRRRNSCLWLQSRSVLDSFGVVLMSCRVNFSRSTIRMQHSASRI